MPRFVLTSLQGRFVIPDGESRAGSDSTCPVCIRGEGVLPVHAYLKAEGAKLLVRPASEQAVLLVDGRPVTGPQFVKAGQLITVGSVQFRLDANGSGAGGLWRRAWFRWTIYGLTGLAALILVAVVLRLLVFNDAWVRSEVLTRLEAALGRDDVELDGLDLHLFSGELVLRGLRIPNKKEYDFAEEKYLFKVAQVRVRTDPWPLVRHRLRGAKVEVTNPELVIERARRNNKPVSNVDDLIAKFTSGPPRQGPIELPFSGIEATLALEGGRVRLKDGYTQIGESSLEGLTIRAEQPGFGNKVAFKVSAATHTPNRPDGTVTLDGEARVINDAGQINTPDIGQGLVRLVLKDFDLPRACAHMNLEFAVLGSQQKVRKLVPGKPLDGEFKVLFPDLRRYEVEAVAQSESLVSLQDGDQAIGNIPTRLGLSLKYDLDKGPRDVDGYLRSAKDLAALADSNPNRHFLSLRLMGAQNSEGVYELRLDGATQVDQLFATDVGVALNLKGRVEGLLNLKATLVRDTQGGLSLQSKAWVSPQFRVLVQGGEGGKEVWQPVPFEASLSGTATPKPADRVLKPGESRYAKLNLRLEAKADCFSLGMDPESKLRDLEITFPDEKTPLLAYADFRGHINGRDFWRTFGPFLDVLGFQVPIQEEAEVKIKIAYDNGDPQEGAPTRRVSLGLDATATPQWKKDDPSPVQVFGKLDYYPEVLKAALAKQPLMAPSGKLRPYLKLDLTTKLKDNLVVVRSLEFLHDGQNETYSIPEVRAESDVAALRARLDPYLRSAFVAVRLLASDKASASRDRYVWMGFNPWSGLWEGVPELKTLALRANREYEQYSLAGHLSGFSSFKVVQGPALNKFGDRALTVEARAAMKGKDFRVGGLLPGADPALTKLPDGRPNRWEWAEPSPEFTIKAQVAMRPAPGDVPRGEELAYRRLDLETLEAHSALGDLVLQASDVDLSLLENLSSDKPLPGKSWADALEKGQIVFTLSAGGFDLAQRLGLLPAGTKYTSGPVPAPQFKLHGQYDRTQDRLSLKELSFQHPKDFGGQAHPEKLADWSGFERFLQLAGYWTQDLKLSAECRKAKALVLKLTHIPAQAGAPFLFQVLEDHLRPGFVQLHSLDFDAPGFAAWAGRQPAAAQALGLPPGFTQSLAQKELRPLDRWTAEKLILWPSDKEERSWLLSGRFSTDLALQLSASTGRAGALPPVLVFQNEPGVGGAWELPEKEAAFLQIAPDFGACSGHVVLEFAHKFIRVDNLGGPWQKPGLPLRLEVQGSFAPGQQERQADALFTVTRLSLTGKDLPLEVALSGLEASLHPTATGPELVKLTLEQAEISSLGLKFGAKNLVYQAPADHVSGTLTVPYLDLDTLLHLIPPQPLMTLSGRIENLTLGIDAQVKHLKDPETLDPRQDKLNLSASVKDLVWQALPAQGESLLVRLNGPLALNATGCAAQGMRLDLVHRLPNEAQPYSLTAQVTALTVTSSDRERASLMQALKQDAPAVDVIAELKCDGLFDLDRLDPILATVQKALNKGQPPAPPKPGAHPFAALRNLHLQGNLSAKQFKSGANTVGDLKLANLSIRDWKVSVPELTGKFWDGDLAVTDGVYDLSDPAIRHTQKLKLLRADLAHVLPPDDPKAAESITYKLGGKLNVDGALSGTGFQQAQRGTWNGQLNLDLLELTARRQGSAKGKVSLLMGMYQFANQMENAGGIMDKVPLDSIPFLKGDMKNRFDMLKGIFSKTSGYVSQYKGYMGKAVGALASAGGSQNPLLPTVGKLANSGAAGMDFILGLASMTERLDFETFHLAVTIKDGKLTLPPSELVAKGADAPLTVRVQGHVDLPRNALDPELLLALVRLPRESETEIKLDKWDPKVRDGDPAHPQEPGFRKKMADGRYVLRYTGSLDNPTMDSAGLEALADDINKGVESIYVTKTGTAGAPAAPPAGTGTPPARPAAPVSEVEKQDLLGQLEDIFGGMKKDKKK